MKKILNHTDGNLFIEEKEEGRKLISVDMFNKRAYVQQKSCETDYPDELIEKILNIKGLAWVCDEIKRDQDSKGVENSLNYGILSYVDKDSFKNKRVLDFGSGSGASIMVAARMFPDTEFVGVELEQDFIEIAEFRANYYGQRNIKFLISPSGNELPENLGQFDHIYLNAVYEHLLPEERKPILDLLWKHLKPDGILFISETPHRYFFFEHHTTELPFIAYMPDKMALYLSRKFSKRVSDNESWESLLRRGIRGGSKKEIMRYISTNEEKPALLDPKYNHVKDHFDLCYERMRNNKDFSLSKRLIMNMCKTLKTLTGIKMVPNINIAIQKADSISAK